MPEGGLQWEDTFIPAGVSTHALPKTPLSSNEEAWRQRSAFLLICYTETRKFSKILWYSDRNDGWWVVLTWEATSQRFLRVLDNVSEYSGFLLLPALTRKVKWQENNSLAWYHLYLVLDTLFTKYNVFLSESAEESLRWRDHVLLQYASSSLLSKLFY